MAATLSVHPDRLSPGSAFIRPPVRALDAAPIGKSIVKEPWRGALLRSRSTLSRTISRVQASSGTVDDSAPFQMSVENARKLLGVSEGASFDYILRAKKSILATCKDDQEAVAQVEAAYDMLLMQSLTQRRAGKVVAKIRYADVKPVKPSGLGSMPQWFQTTVKNSPVSIETPSTSALGVQSGVYGALMGLTYINDASTSTGSYAATDFSGLILAGSFGASLYFMTKKNV